MFKFFGAGRTYWESSYFGGVKRILTEYPFYSINYDLYADLASESKAGKDLSIHQQDKLVNILLSQGFSRKEYKDSFSRKLIDDIYATLKVDKLYQERLVMLHGKPKLRIPVCKKQLQSMIHLVSDSELKSIFDEYGDSIVDPNSKIVIMCDVPNDPDKKKGPGSTPPPATGKDKSPDGDGSSKSKKNEPTPPDISSEKLVQFASKKANDFVRSFRDKNDVESMSVRVEEVEDGARPVVFQDSEVVFAKKLEKILDITHEPKPEVVKNLLHGKMDTEKLAEILSGNSRIHMNRLENQSVKPFKVIVLGDYSGSMDCGIYHETRGRITRLAFQQGVMRSLFYLFNDLLGMDDIEFYGHSGDSDPVLYRFHSPEYPRFTDTFTNDDISLCENYDGPIIEHIHKMVRLKSSKPVLLISLSDGSPSGNNYGGPKAITNMKKIMEKIKRDNFVTVGIGIGYSHQPDLYQYSVDLHDFSEVSPIARIVNRAVKENLVSED